VIGLIIGTSRIISVLTNFFFGPIGDKLNPRKIILISEFGAMLSSLMLFWLSFSLTNDSYFYFIFAIVIRAFFTGIQQASVQKYGKHFDERLNLQGSFSKKLNQVTFGSIFFAMIINLIAIKKLTFGYIIVFDALTFLINGFLLMFSSGKNEIEVETQKRELNILKNWKLNLKYFEVNPEIYLYDFILAIVMMGANTLNILLLASNRELVPFASGIFGLTVWLAPIIDKKIKVSQSIWWRVISVSIVMQIFMHDYPIIILGLSFFRNLSYWQIYNHISSNIMLQTPKEVFASVSSGRNVGINLIGASGEFWTGLQCFSFSFELLWRAGLALFASLFKQKPKI
jgi:MFS family permease